MAKCLINKLILSVILIVHCNWCKEVCISQTSCVCKIDTSSIVDLTPHSDNEKPIELVDSDQHGNTYYFYGCINSVFDPKTHGINTTEPPANTSLVIANMTHFQSLGSANDIKFDNVDGKQLSLIYSLPNGSVTASIALVCSGYAEPVFKVKSTNEFLLLSTSSCPIDIHNEISTGTILLIIFFTSCIFYFVGGGFVLYVFRGARGHELIPHGDFWFELPHLVKDGVVFLLSGCTVAPASAESYDQI